MPNHVANRIVCTGPVEDVAAFKQLMIVPNTDETYTRVRPWEDPRSFDFNRIIPMPVELEDTKSFGSDAILRVLDIAEGRPLEKPTILNDIFFEMYWKRCVEDVEKTDLPKSTDQEIANSYFQLHPNSLEQARKDRAMVEKTGYPSWYPWSLDNWGTKWNSYSFGEIKDHATYEFGFDTAWSPPIPVLDKLVERFPNLTFDVAWFDEGWCHAGQGVIGADDFIRYAASLYTEPNDEIYERVYGEAPIHYNDEESFLAIGDAFMQEAENVRFSNNLTCFNVSASSDDQGYYPIAGTYYSDDIEFSDDELFEMRTMRDRILTYSLQSD